MASTLSLPSKILYALLALLLISSFQWQPSTARRAHVDVPPSFVNMLCDKTTNPPFCVDTLNNEPRTPYMDINTIQSEALNLAYMNASNTLEHINGLLQQKDDPDRDRVLKCQKFYIDATSDLDQASDRYDHRDYAGTITWAQKARNESFLCEGVWSDPPPSTSPLTMYNDYFGDLASIIVAIAQIHLEE